MSEDAASTLTTAPCAVPVFQVFTVTGKKFLAIPRNFDGTGPVHIIGQFGENWGSWQSVVSFQKDQLKAADVRIGAVLGYARPVVRPLVD